MRNWLIIAIILVVPLVTYAVLDNSPNQKAVSGAAVQVGKPLVLRFSTPLCLDCKLLEKEFVKVQPRYEGQVLVRKIDVMGKGKEAKALMDKYDVNVAPTTIFIGKDGKTFKKVEGLMEEKTLDKRMKALVNE